MTPYRPIRPPMKSRPMGLLQMFALMPEDTPALERLKALLEEKIQEAGHFKEVFEEKTREVERALEAVYRIKEGPAGPEGTRGPQGMEGIRGPVGLSGIDGRPGTDGKDGVSPDPKAVAAVLKKTVLAYLKTYAKDGPPGKDGPQLEEVLTAFAEQLARGTKKLPLEAIAGLEGRLAEMRNHVARQSGMRGGGDTVVAGPGVTITNTVNGNKRISATASVPVWKTPPESPDGVTTIFTVSSIPSEVVADGATFFDGAGYTYAAGQITFVNPPTQYVRYQ